MNIHTLLIRRRLFLEAMGINAEWLLNNRNSTSQAQTSLTPALSSSSTTHHILHSNKEISAQSFSTLSPASNTLQPVDQNLITEKLNDLHTNRSSEAISKMDWTMLEQTVSTCQRCNLCKTRTQTVFGTGPQHADWMVIGEAPGEHEDRQGQPFVGQAGKLLDNMLQALSLTRTHNVYIANILKCRPPGNRNPHPDEIAYCTPYLQQQIALLKPKCILLMGRFAAQTLLKTEATIGKLRGQIYFYENIPTIVTYHPAYLLRSPQEKSKAWADLCIAKQTMLKK